MAKNWFSEHCIKTKACFDEVVCFCQLYCLSRMWINNGESVACHLSLVHVQTSIHHYDSRLTDRHVFMLVLLICYSFLFQKWISISTRKTKKPPKCELCHYQFNRHKKFRVNSLLVSEEKSVVDLCLSTIKFFFFEIWVLFNSSYLRFIARYFWPTFFWEVDSCSHGWWQCLSTYLKRINSDSEPET